VVRERVRLGNGVVELASKIEDTFMGMDTTADQPRPPAASACTRFVRVGPSVDRGPIRAAWTPVETAPGHRGRT
jgi:hypothetical protein